MIRLGDQQGEPDQRIPGKSLDSSGLKVFMDQVIVSATETIERLMDLRFDVFPD